MRILIDECVDERLRNYFPGHECETVRHAGMMGFRNGDLIAAAETAEFDVLLTVDQGLEFEQNLRDRAVAILVIKAKSNRLKDLLPNVAECLVQLKSIKPGQLVKVSV